MDRPLKIAVIVDNHALSRFERDVIDAIRDCDSISVFSCRNTRTRKRPLQHGAYYALNLLAVRNAQTRRVAVATSNKAVGESIEFDSIYDGAWQSLPPAVIERMRDLAPDVILRFGMSLMRVPPDLGAPILSYHHGDPDKYRGRPAGFYELINGEPAVGQIVQVLSDRLDAGAVVAYAETRAMPHSWRATLTESFRHSPLIINEAICNALSGRDLGKTSKGRNYRLPSNWTVVRFAAARGGAMLRRLVYGALFEKAWRVSTAAVEPKSAIDGAFPDRRGWQTAPLSPGHTLHADPFFAPEGGDLLVEGISRRTGKGELLRLSDDGAARVSLQPGHFSYPACVEEAGMRYVVPEVAGWSTPRAFILGDDGLAEAGALRMPDGVRVQDPTFLRRSGKLYLFGNDKRQGSGALNIWVADGLFEPFALHPQSPVRVSPRGARMAGEFAEENGRTIRFGQNFLGGYGDGIFAFEIEELTPDTYREREIGALQFTGVKGPHTLNFRDGLAVFDWYRDRFAPLAGVRRLLARLR